MSEATSRLSDEQVDGLADALERIAKPASKVTNVHFALSKDPTRKMGVMRAQDYPENGLTTACTFGLAHETFRSANFPDRIELVQTWGSPSLEYERLLAVVAETIILRGRPPKPGVVYQDAVRIANLPKLAEKMPHALVMFPYLWSEGFTRVDLEKDRIWFLQIVPIYDNEMQFIERQG
jgi:hypothetical protein